MNKQKSQVLNTPVLFIVFNRLDTTKAVFKEIRKARPGELFIASDGPRENVYGERELIEKIRREIIEKVDWPCKIKTLFREKNLGCKYAVSGAIYWFFRHVKMGIILEDDCLPNQSFFKFCEDMLERYKDNESIAHISGTNIETVSRIPEDFFLSNCFNVWGWATWARAWKNYDIGMKFWKKVRFGNLFLKLTDRYDILTKIRSWRLYQLTYSGKINTWDYQWDFECKRSGKKSIIPSRNLIRHIGFEKGTHTTNYKKELKSLKRKKYKPNGTCTPERNYEDHYLERYINFFKN
jgi:hypothetical protein